VVGAGLGGLIALTGCGGEKASSNASAVRVHYSASLPGVLIPADCSGTACEVTGSTTYQNASAVVWSYRNNSDQPVTVDIDFNDLSRDQEITYVFSNGTAQEAAYAPATGITVAAGGSLAPTVMDNATAPQAVFNPSMQSRHDDWHASHGNDQLLTFRKVQGSRSLAAQVEIPLPGRAASATLTAGSLGPATLGEVRPWFDNISEKVVSLKAQLVCNDGGQRRIALWADEAASANGAPATSEESLAAYRKVLCGSTGAVGRLKTLLGNVWGPHNSTRYISDGAGGAQDLNVLLLSAGANAPWGGYFYAVNTCKVAVCPTSNEALAVFINADLASNYLPYLQSIFIHELTHMINWYERSVVRQLAPHERWMEEMKAMMGEDIVSRTLIRDASGQPFNAVVTAQLPKYLNTGGGLSLVDWPVISKASGHYGMAGGFGAYLNRQYGLGIFKNANKECTDSTSLYNSWVCLDTLIKKHGGVSAAESFNQYGTAVFSLSSGQGPSSKFSFMAREEDGYVLPAVDLRAYRAYRPGRAAATPIWSATTQTYLTERLNLGIFLFTRRSIVVPPKTHLSVTVQ